MTFQYQLAPMVDGSLMFDNCAVLPEGTTDESALDALGAAYPASRFHDDGNYLEIVDGNRRILYSFHRTKDK